MTEQRRSWWGWGWTAQALSDEECVRLAALIPGLATAQSPVPVPDLADLELPTPRIRPPSALAHLCTTRPAARAGHSYGKAYRDVVRALSGDLTGAPDLVARPRSEADIIALLDWAMADGIVVVPYGGGSSVVGGVEYRGQLPWLSLDMCGLDRVLEVDPVSRAARIQAGALGPGIEEQLRPHGYTLRHFPQSFEFSTLGGWLATRAGGHYATAHTHIDDFVESMRVVTPQGVSESWRLPASGAGPAPDRLFLGSEGTLGVITEAWLRVQDRPTNKASAAVRFDGTAGAFEASRAIAQSGLNPANCRLLDPGEAALSGADQSGGFVLLLGFESARRPVDASLADAVSIATAHGGHLQDTTPASGQDPAQAWRSAFLRMPYIRDGLTRMSAIVETFETSCTWDRAPALYEAVRSELGTVLRTVTGSPGLVNCRLTHVYPDGAAPYFTVIAPGRRGSEVAMWDEIKAAASEVLHRFGASITHHHAVGRDHRRWYDQQRPEPFAVALTATKRALDPEGILNPGVLIDH